MRRKLFTVLIVSMVGMLAVPGLNITLTGKTPWDHPSQFYKVDFARSVASWILLPFGISIKPGDTLIGRDGWLFLGDDHDQSVSSLMREFDSEDRIKSRATRRAMTYWEQYFKDNGVSLFRIMIGPNKSSVYPEKLPGWLKPSLPSVTDAILAEQSNIFIDLRPALVAAKASSKYPLYYTTDTHWNLVGAASAFRQFARDLSSDAPDIRWPDENLYVARGVSERTGGDLSAFLGLLNIVKDQEPHTSLNAQDFRSVHREWNSGKVLYDGPLATVETSRTPLLIHTEKALNQRRVLWLRDSFGINLAPLMALTFSDVLQDHWIDAINPDVLPRLVESFKPDYVFITVVERDILDPHFAQMPPIIALAESTAQSSRMMTSILKWSNGVEVKHEQRNFVVVGQDPYMSYELEAPHEISDQTFVHLALKCDGGNRHVPVQIFWATRVHPEFSEDRSIRFVYDADLPNLKLKSLGLKPRDGDLIHFRLDIDDPSTCRQFWFDPPSFFEASDKKK